MYDDKPAARIDSETLTKSAAIELGASNITVNAIAPGPVNTPLYRSEGQLRSTGLTSFEEQDQVVGAFLPLKVKPALDPQDIADTATFLASDQARFISGEVIDVALGHNTIYNGLKIANKIGPQFYRERKN
jgi:NAD(P)-dependent dehydrogenase (short-subunit alcohol dehydrogenase family)